MEREYGEYDERTAVGPAGCAAKLVTMLVASWRTHW